MIPGFALQQLRCANSILTSGRQPLRIKLELAYEQLEPLIAADFPKEMCKEYGEIISQLAKLRCEPAAASISDQETSRLAKQIAALHGAMEAASDSSGDSSGEVSLNEEIPF